ncbi:MAG: c-type cytochrome [Chloroflexi bacterium]|nr:c-type cytochrome [Chloroflexota bacterium]
MKGGKVAPTPAAIGLITTAIIFVAAIACGSATSSAAIDPAPTPTLAPIATVASGDPSPTVAPPTEVPESTPVLITTGPSDEELIAQGKEIFVKTAGGVGCALCHGLDAKGDPSQGAPDNRGASADTIFAALASRPQMSFITLTNDEIDAVAAYLAFLATQP